MELLLPFKALQRYGANECFLYSIDSAVELQAASPDYVSICQFSFETSKMRWREMPCRFHCLIFINEWLGWLKGLPEGGSMTIAISGTKTLDVLWQGPTFDEPPGITTQQCQMGYRIVDDEPLIPDESRFTTSTTMRLPAFLQMCKCLTAQYLEVQCFTMGLVLVQKHDSFTTTIELDGEDVEYSIDAPALRASTRICYPLKHIIQFTRNLWSGFAPFVKIRLGAAFPIQFSFHATGIGTLSWAVAPVDDDSVTTTESAMELDTDVDDDDDDDDEGSPASDVTEIEEQPSEFDTESTSIDLGTDDEWAGDLAEWNGEREECE